MAKNWFLRNWHLKLISLILATGLWYYAVGEEGIEVTRTIPLEVKVENPNMSLLKLSSHVIQVTFLAPRGSVSALTKEGVRAVHVMKNDVNKAGEYSFRLERGEIQLESTQIRIVKMEPETIQLTLDEIMVKKTEVKAQFEGEPAFGYKVRSEEVQLNPNAVLIQGPKGTVEKLEAVKTQKISLVGKTRSLRQTITLDLPPNLKLIGEPLIDLYVPINEESDEKEFKDIPLRLIQTPGDEKKALLEPEKLTVTLKGSKKLLAKMDASSMFFYVDITSLKRGEYDRPVESFLPEGVEIKDGPVQVKVKVEK